MRVGDFIKEGIDYGIVLSCGPVAFDVVWVGGSTSRYRHGVRMIEVVDAATIDDFTRRHLAKEAASAKAERARGAGVRRGQVSPSR